MASIPSYQTFQGADLNVKYCAEEECAICYTPFDQREHAPVSHIQTLPGTSERVQIACNRAFCCLACYPTWSHHEVSGRACPLCRGPREFMVIRHPVEGELCLLSPYHNLIIRNNVVRVRQTRVYEEEETPGVLSPLLPHNQIFINVYGEYQNRAEALADISSPSLRIAVDQGAYCAAFYAASIVFNMAIALGPPAGGIIVLCSSFISCCCLAHGQEQYNLYRRHASSARIQQLVVNFFTTTAVGCTGLGMSIFGPIAVPWVANWEAVSSLSLIAMIFVVGTAASYIGQRVGGEWQRAYIVERFPEVIAV